MGIRTTRERHRWRDESNRERDKERDEWKEGDGEKETMMERNGAGEIERNGEREQQDKHRKGARDGWRERKRQKLRKVGRKTKIHS